MYLHYMIRALTYSILTLLLAVTSIASTNAQATWMVLEGKVINDETKAGIPFATVAITGTNFGTTTDATGAFKLSVRSIPASLALAHISYTNRTVTVTADDDLNNLELSMEPSSTAIPEVQISANRVDTIFPDKTRNIWDYAFLGEEIMVIDFYSRLAKGRLSMLSFFGDTLATIPVPAKPEMFYEDCLKQPYLICEDRVYPIEWDFETLRLSKPMKRSDFMQYANNCVDHSWPTVFFNEPMHNDMAQHYYGIDQLSRDFTSLDIIADSTILHQFKNDLLVADPNSESPQGRFMYQYYVAAYGSPGRAARHMGWDKQFREQIVYKAGYNPLFVIKDQVFIFNHTNSRLKKFTPKGKLVKSSEINYHKTRAWNKEIIVDEINNKAYALLLNKGVVQIQLIDLETGKTKPPQKIKFPFVEKVKIRDGFVYFLYKGIGETKRRLYRIPVTY